LNELELAGRPSYVGARVARVEDDRLLSGRGTFIADLTLPGMAEVAILRSQVAHARITDIRTDAARSVPGVISVVTAGDLEDVKPFPDFFDYVRPVAAFPLCQGHIRYVGAPLAAVVASDRYVAEDAVEALEVGYDDLPAVGSIEAALAPGAPVLYEGWPDNRMMDVPGIDPAVDEAFAAASRIVRGAYSIQRHAAVPLETRGSLAEFRHGRLTLWTGTQSPHIARTMLSYVLPLAERDIRVIAPDVGGSFGCKCHVYGEDVLVCWLAMKLGRPVRWIEDRAEHMVATVHSREHVVELEAVVQDDGRIAAIRSHVTQDVGAEDNVWFSGINVSFVAAGHVTGPYKIPLAQNHVTCVVTNKTPSGAFRGFGIPEMVFALERLVDKIAKEVEVDPVELRRSMLVTDDDLPYVTATGGVYDSGSFREAFDRAVQLGRESESRARARFGGDDGVRIGLGVATYAEGTAPTYFGTTGHWTAHDAASIRVEPDGSVIVSVGVTTTGQGVTTMVATLAADALGVSRDVVSVRIGDTDLCPYGLGGWGSRSTVVGGGAVLKAAARVRERILRIAGHLLEADPQDLVVENGLVHVKGSDRPAVSIAEVATAATVRTVDLPLEIERGLEATASYEPPGLQHRPDERGKINGAVGWANATHAAVVKVDLATGEVEVLDYIVTHDCGPIINPLIVDGQVQGGVAQGIGGTLYEHIVYSEEGQPLTASFMDYLIPSATEIPAMTIEHFESPSPNLPLGVKGVGEGGVIGAPAAIGNALANALEEFGVEITSTPFTPNAIRTMLRTAAPREAAAGKGPQ
jgi:aerobic carbon-monoxide dehydrogenase large subunit